MHGPRRLGGLPVGMDAHAAEVVAEARLHEGAGSGIQRLTGGTQHLMHDGRDGARVVMPGGAALERGLQPAAFLFLSGTTLLALQ